MKKKPLHRSSLLALSILGFSIALVAKDNPEPVGENKGVDNLAAELTKLSKIDSGLVVIIGASDGQLALDFLKQGRFLVHSLEPDAKKALRAQKLIHSSGSYGQAWVENRQLNKLPYAENLVNLIVVDNFSPYSETLPFDEILRVLRPGGVAIVGLRQSDNDKIKDSSADDIRNWMASGGVVDIDFYREAGLWARFVKPWPDGMDDWTHPRHGPDGNVVSQDQFVGVPRRVRWVAGPLRKNEAAVSADGRIIYGGILARDAFNGLRIWKEANLATDEQVTDAVQIQRYPISVIVGQKLYAPRDGKLWAMDAATGDRLFPFEEAGSPEQLLVKDNRLITIDSNSVRAFDPDTGSLLWHFKAAEPRGVVVGDKNLYMANGNVRRGEKVSLLSLSLDSGKIVWKKDQYDDWAAKVTSATYHNQSICFEVSTFSDNDEGLALHIVDANTGEQRWERAYEPGKKAAGMTHFKQARGLFIDDTLWVLGEKNFTGFDPKEGSELKKFPASFDKCYPPLASSRYLFSGEQMMTNLKTGKIEDPLVTKGACSRTSGFIAANGLIYATPKHCVCWPMLRGFAAFAPDLEASRSTLAAPAPSDFELKQLGLEVASRSVGKKSNSASDEWPAYRRDSRRSGSTGMKVPKKLEILWQADLGSWKKSSLLRDWKENPFVLGPISSPVAANGVVVVARPDAHEIVALDAKNGQALWRFTADGRIDSAPTLYRGLCLFGTRSGSVYALRLSDGSLAWRLSAGRSQERIVAFGQLESPWPVPGSILIANDTAYFTAGRNFRVNGGVLVFALVPQTGVIKWVTAVDDAPGLKYKGASTFEFDGIDLLVEEDEPGSEQSWVSYSRWRLDPLTGKVHLKAESGYSYHDTSETRSGGVMAPRGWWSYGPRQQRDRTIRRPLVVFNGASVYGSTDTRSRLFRRELNRDDIADFDGTWSHKRKIFSLVEKGGPTSRNANLARNAHWMKQIFPENKTEEPKDPAKRKRLIKNLVLAYGKLTNGHEGIEAMVLTADQLFSVGGEGTLTSLSTENGEILFQMNLEAPIWDGMAAAYNKLYLSTANGKLICLGQKAP